MNPQTRVNDRMPAGNAAWMEVELYHARNMRSQNCMSVNEPMLMISGYATRNTSA